MYDHKKKAEWPLRERDIVVSDEPVTEILVFVGHRALFLVR